MEAFYTVIANLFHILGIILICSSLFGMNKRHCNKYIKLATVVLADVSNVVFNSLVTNYNLQVVFYILCIFVVIKIFYLDDNKKTIISIICGILIANVLGIFFAEIVNGIIKVWGISLGGISSVVGSALAYGLLVAISMLINKKANFLENISNKFWVIFTINVVADATMLLIFLVISDRQITNKSKNAYIVLYIVLAISVFLQMAFLVYILISRNIHRENEMLAKKYLEEQKNYYEYLEQREVETKKFRHDMRNHLYLLDKVKKEGKNEEFEKYLQDIIERVDRLGTKVNVGNDIANAILDKYYAEAINKGINIQIQGHFPINCSVSAYHLCTIFSNLLSNAIEAAEKATIKKVWVICRYTENEIIIEIGNSYCDNNLNKKNLKTKKPEKQYHGWGLKNVEDSVNACNGLIDIEIENGCFVVSVTLKNNEV